MNSTIRVSHSNEVNDYHERVFDTLFKNKDLDNDDNMAKQHILWKNLTFENNAEPNVYQIASAFRAARKRYALLDKTKNRPNISIRVDELNEMKWYDCTVLPLLPQCLR